MARQLHITVAVVWRVPRQTGAGRSWFAIAGALWLATLPPSAAVVFSGVARLEDREALSWLLPFVVRACNCGCGRLVLVSGVEQHRHHLWLTGICLMVAVFSVCALWRGMSVRRGRWYPLALSGKAWSFARGALRWRSNGLVAVVGLNSVVS